MERYKRLIEKYKIKENNTFIMISNANLDPFQINLTKDSTAKTAIGRSKAIIAKKVNPYELPIIKLNVNKQGQLRISDGNARLLVYQYYKKPIRSFLIVKNHSDVEGIKLFLKNLK